MIDGHVHIVMDMGLGKIAVKRYGALVMAAIDRKV